MLELIQRDFFTLIDLTLVGGSKYFVTFVDDFLRYIIVYMMKQKYKENDKFRELVNIGENCTGVKVERLHSDNSGKYFSKESYEFFKGCSIQRESTIPYSPQQNGIEERMNRVLLETARSMMYHDKRFLNL